MGREREGDCSGLASVSLDKQTKKVNSIEIYLQILLTMKHDRFGFHFSVLDVDLVAGEHNRNGLANSNQISMPVRHVLVGDSRGDIEHDDGALALNVVAVSQTAEFLLTGSILFVVVVEHC